MRCYYAYTCIANFLVLALAYGIQSQISHYNNLWTVFLWLVRGDLLLLALWQRVRFIWDGTALQMLDYSFTKHYCGAQTRASHLSPASHHIFYQCTLLWWLWGSVQTIMYTLAFDASRVSLNNIIIVIIIVLVVIAPIAPSMRSMLLSLWPDEALAHAKHAEETENR